MLARANALFQQGYGLHKKGLLLDAKRLYHQVLALQPRHADALHLLGMIAGQEHDHQLAAELIGQALQIAPANASAHYNHGKALQELKLYQLALDSYMRAVELRSDYAIAYFNMGLVLEELKQYPAAISSLEKVISLDARNDWMLGMLLRLKMLTCNWHSLEEIVTDIISGIKRGEKFATPFEILSAVGDLDIQKQASSLWIQAIHPNDIKYNLIPFSEKKDKICIGYYSADFHQHATAQLMAELFELHDKTRFELIAFSFGPDSNDPMRQRLLSAFDRFIDVRGLTDVEAAALSRRLRVDIAVDLKGCTKDERMGIFAARAAPVQLSYIGYPGTLGAQYIDYLVADKVLIPEEYQRFYLEKIIYLPGSYQVNDRTRPISDKTFTREELGLPSNGFVFCCFNNNYKITPTIFDCWMRILAQVDGSVIWLFESNSWAATNLRSEAQRRGIDPSRLIFAPRMPLPEHLARHRQAGLFLDTLPYNAHTTASDALWAGLPVLTCAGSAFAARVAASLLSAIELPELITTSAQDYEALAVNLATNPSKLAALRQKLRQNRLSTPLFNTPSFCRHLETAYLAIYERYQVGLEPEHIDVQAITFKHPCSIRCV